MTITLIIVAAIVGVAVGFFLPSSKLRSSLGNEQKKIDEAKAEAETIANDAKEKLHHMKESFKDEESSMQSSIKSMEESLKQKESMIQRRQDRSNTAKAKADKIANEIKATNSKRKELRAKSVDALSKTSGISREKALEQARQGLEDIITENKDKRAAAQLEEFEEDIMRHAKAVLQIVIQRLGVPSSVDQNSTSINVKDDRFKGMLIGKNGTNIEYLESLLPVAIIFNHGDSDTIHVGGVNLLRRNIAKKAIEKLQRRVKKAKGIDHAMIKIAIAESEKEIMDLCDQKGSWACKQMGLNPKQIQPKLVNYVGRLYLRTSYGQNIIHHSLEMGHAARLISELIDVDVNVAAQAAFFHDIGKAIDHDVGGAHDDLSKEILEEFNYDPRIVHAAFAHHDKVPCESPEDFIVKAVDAISGGRPGARMESVTNYFERMKQLEDCAKAFSGVGKVLTMSAGREVRVMVDKDQIKDDNMQELADSVAGKISEEVSFPGIIKVNLIRRTKSVDYAREKSRKH